ncbi:hypothetical protein ACIGGF_25225 [Rhodococcus sp. NPDC078407]|uniref:hypothetical protein n=1 Tax=Rhodococcus sp. NPDC078407 TaxID=3364509 RepID=UPI0037CB5860
MKNYFVWAIDEPVYVTGNPWSLNGIADEAWAVDPIRYTAAMRVNGPPPKMFRGGLADLPGVTGSGLDPQELEKVPYRLRHFVAGLTDLEQAQSLVGKITEGLPQVWLTSDL